MSESRASYFREYRARRAAERDATGLLPFQSAFVAAVCRKEQPPEISGLSCPRANGKSWLAGGLVARSLTAGDPLFEPARTRLGSFWSSLGLRWVSRTATAGAMTELCIWRAERAFASFQATPGGPWD